MKKIILLTTLLIQSYSHAETFQYDSISNFEDFDGIFILSNTHDDSRKIKLDCQSYFQKVDIFDRQNTMLSENYITYGECEYLYKTITECLETENSKCVDSEDIFNSSCKCQ